MLSVTAGSGVRAAVVSVKSRTLASCAVRWDLGDGIVAGRERDVGCE
jgi:hypothetical protein